MPSPLTARTPPAHAGPVVPCVRNRGAHAPSNQLPLTQAWMAGRRRRRRCVAYQAQRTSEWASNQPLCAATCRVAPRLAQAAITMVGPEHVDMPPQPSCVRVCIALHCIAYSSCQVVHTHPRFNMIPDAPILPPCHARLRWQPERRQRHGRNLRAGKRGERWRDQPVHRELRHEDRSHRPGR